MLNLGLHLSLVFAAIATTTTATTATSEKSEEVNLRRRELNQKELQEHARLFVQYKSPRGRRIARRCARNIIQDFENDNIILIQGSGRCLDQLSRDVDIDEVEFDEEVTTLGFKRNTEAIDSPNRNGQVKRYLDEIYPWGLQMIQANEVTTGENNITVCIVDTGIAMGHPDLSTDRITGTDVTKFWGPVWPWNSDVDGHGTHVAGTIAALSGNDVGVAGAGSFRLHIVRALDDDGRGYESDIRNAVEQCVEAGAKIVNLSLGGNSMSSRSRRYYTEVVEEHGIMLIAAAGNDGMTPGRHVYPASHPSVIAVGAVYEWESRWTQSQRNDQVELAAPGHNILSTTSALLAIRTADYAYTAFHIPGTSPETVSGELVRCDAGDKKCKDAKNGKICLFSKDGADIAVMVESCEKGGGAGAILFSADGSNIGSWSARDGANIRIPAYAVSHPDGRELLDREEEEVTIGDAGDDGVEYSYVEKSGTSMASPHVAAAAALLWSNFERCTNHQIRYALTRNAHHPQGGSCDQNFGHGIVKTKDAYDWLSENPCDSWDIPQISTGGCSAA